MVNRWFQVSIGIIPSDKMLEKTTITNGESFQYNNLGNNGAYDQMSIRIETLGVDISIVGLYNY
jgi:hypothetical protein